MEAGVITRRFANVWKDTWVNIAAQLFVIRSAWTAEVAPHPECAAAHLDFRAAIAKEVSQSELIIQNVNLLSEAIWPNDNEKDESFKKILDLNEIKHHYLFN